jgi:Domain of unknown function (DUF4185)
MDSMRFSLKYLALISLLYAVCGTALAQDHTASGCTPAFPLRQPWLGADAAYSIPLPDGRDVWIFGDTLYGKTRQVTGDDPRMVRNTIGISTCKAGKWDLDYVIRQGSDGKFLDFFQSQRKGTWYWALDGVQHDHELWVTLLCVRNSPKDHSAMGFEICGTDLAHVTGLNGDPQKWEVSISPLVEESAHANPSASAVIRGEYLYIYTLYESGSRPAILTRIPLSGLSEPKKNLQYLGSDDAWHDGLEPAKAKTIMQHGAAEMSVRYHPELKKWIAVMVDPTMFSDKIILRTGTEMTGPWTEGEVIYHIPEMQKDTPGYDSDTFCYAGKEHPEFEKPGELVFTYVCNTMKPKKLESETNIYAPQLVRMPMPETAKQK